MDCAHKDDSKHARKEDNNNKGIDNAEPVNTCSFHCA